MFAGGGKRLPDCPLLLPPTWGDVHLSGSCATETEGVASETEGEHGSWGVGTVLCLLMSLAFCGLGVSAVIKGREGGDTADDDAVPDVYQQYSAAASAPHSGSMEDAANVRAAKAQRQPPPSTQAAVNPLAQEEVGLDRGTGMMLNTRVEDDAEGGIVSTIADL